jgi:hypothetical protein
VRPHLKKRAGRVARGIGPEFKYHKKKKKKKGNPELIQYSYTKQRKARGM